MIIDLVCLVAYAAQLRMTAPNRETEGKSYTFSRGFIYIYLSIYMALALALSGLTSLAAARDESVICNR